MRHDAIKAKRGEAVQSMPKQPPAPIHIRIDTQEQRSGIPDLLAAMPQVHIEVMPLHMGDSAEKQAQNGHATSGPAAGRRRATRSEQQMQIVLALPGVGRTTARAVCARFRSLHDLLNADAATLATVPGVGPSRAAALEQLLHAALPSSGAGRAGGA